MSSNEEKTFPNSDERSEGSIKDFIMNPILFPAHIQPYEDRVLAKLKGPNLLEWICEVLRQRIVGEDLNKLTLFLTALSYKMNEPQSAIVHAPPSSGKSWLCYNVLRLFPNVINLSRITYAVLDRIGSDLSHYILYVSELGGHEQATPTLRVMLSEGELRLACVDPETKQPMVIETKGTPVYITTTTQDIVELQLASRTWLLGLDTSKEQTRRILGFQAKQASSIIKSDYTEDEMVLRCLIYKLKPYQVLVPYADKLSALFPIEEPQARRDFKRLLSMIKCLTLLFQELRAKIESNGEEVLLSNLTDLAHALKLVKPILFTTLYRLPESAFEILKLFKEAGTSSSFVVRDISPKVNLSQNRTREIMNGLADRGFLFIDESGRAHLYYWSGKELEEPTILSIVVSESFFSLEEFQKWFNSESCRCSKSIKELYETYILPSALYLSEQLQQIEKTIKPSLEEEKKPIEVTTEKIVPISRLYDGELIILLRSRFGLVPFLQDEFQNEIIKHGPRTKEESEKLFQRLVDEGSIFMTSDGYWRWV